MADRRQRLWVIGLAGLVALVAVWFVVPRGSRPSSIDGEESERPSAAPQDGESGQATRTRPGAGRPDRDDDTDLESEAGTERAAADAVTNSADGAPPGDAEEAEWVKQPSTEFTEADLARAGEGVQVDLGEYRVRVGDQIDVQVRLTAPPMESATLMFGYDPGKLSVIPDSARPVGQYFRRGIEFYVDEAGGRAVLIHTGKPGMKNINGATGAPVASFRLRALAEGDCTLSLVGGTSFSNGRGSDEEYSVYGGAIHIR